MTRTKKLGGVSGDRPGKEKGVVAQSDTTPLDLPVKADGVKKEPPYCLRGDYADANLARRPRATSAK